MNTSEIYETWINEILDEVRPTRALIEQHPDPFGSSLLFSAVHGDYYFLKTIQQNLLSIIPDYFAQLTASICSVYDIKHCLNLQRKSADPQLTISLEGKTIECYFWAPHGNSITHDFDTRKKTEKTRRKQSVLVILTTTQFPEPDSSDLQPEEQMGFRSMTAPDLYKWLFNMEEANNLLLYSAEARAKLQKETRRLILGEPSLNENDSFRFELERKFIEEYAPAAENLFEAHGIREDLIAPIKKNFIESGLYKCLFGRSDFADSFCSAEWLFSTIGEMLSIEQTGTVTGYLKCVEQLEYQLIKILADSTNLSISLPKQHQTDQRTTGQRGYFDYEHRAFTPLGENEKPPLGKKAVWKYPLTSGFITEESKNLTLGVLNNFFSSSALSKDAYRQDILAGIEEKSPYTLFRILHKMLTDFASEARNELLHKANTHDSRKLAQIRTQAIAIPYLLLGSLRLDENSINQLSIDNNLRTYIEDLADAIRISLKKSDFASITATGKIHFIFFRQGKSPSWLSVYSSCDKAGYEFANNMEVFPYKWSEHIRDDEAFYVAKQALLSLSNNGHFNWASKVKLTVHCSESDHSEDIPIAPQVGKKS